MFRHFLPFFSVETKRKKNKRVNLLSVYFPAQSNESHELLKLSYGNECDSN